MFDSNNKRRSSSGMGANTMNTKKLTGNGITLEDIGIRSGAGWSKRDKPMTFNVAAQDFGDVKYHNKTRPKEKHNAKTNR